MKKAIQLVIMAVLVGMLATSCGSQKQNAGQTSGGEYVSSKDRLTAIAQYGSWNTLTAGGKVALGAGKSMSSSMQLKMVRGKSISISMRPLLGIEVAKIHIEGDQIVIIDRIHHIYIEEKASLLTSGVPVDVTTMQDLLLGRAHILGKGTLSSKMSGDVTLNEKDGVVTLTPKQTYEGFGYAYTFDADNHLVALDVYPDGEASIYNILYGNTTGTVAGTVATLINASTTIAGKPVTLDLNLKNLQWNGSVDNSLEIPSGYSKTDASAILKSLGATTTK